MNERIYERNGIVIDFMPNNLGSYYRLSLKKGNFVFDERNLDELARTEDLSRKLQVIDNIFYMGLTRRNVKDISRALKKVKKDYDENLKAFKKRAG